MKTPSLAVIPFLVAIVIAGCGGGSGVDSGGTGAAPAVSQGVITAKGSIFVNGIEYSTSGASIKVDGISVVDDLSLKEGMVVTVRGTSDDATRTGSATQIEARDILEGTISSVDAPNKTITVMGQTVRIEDNVTRLNDDNTKRAFGDVTWVPGNFVEVHGFADDPIRGGVRATRVVNKATGEFESKGFVTALAANSFGLALTPGGASVVTVNFTAGQLPAGTVNGSFVEVKSTATPSGGNVTASLIHLEDGIGVAGQKVEVEGIVTSGTLGSFFVNGKQVVTSASTLFEGGVSGDFSVGVKLEAEGSLDANGAIAATKISFRSNFKIEGEASNVTATSLTVLGKSIAINQFTRIDNPPLVAGRVEVRALSDRDDNLIAARIVVGAGNPGRAFLQGPVTAANGTAGTLTILGTPIVSDNSTTWRASSTSTELAVTKADFFAQVRINVTVVKVRWDNFTATTVPIKEAEIELGK